MTICVFTNGNMISDSQTSYIGELGKKIHCKTSAKIHMAPENTPMFDDGVNPPIKPDFIAGAGSTKTAIMIQLNIVGLLAQFGLTAFVPGYYTLNITGNMQPRVEGAADMIFRCGEQCFTFELHGDHITISELKDNAIIGSGTQAFKYLIMMICGGRIDFKRALDLLNLMIVTGHEPSVGGSINILEADSSVVSLHEAVLHNKRKERLLGAFRDNLYKRAGIPLEAPKTLKKKKAKKAEETK